MDQVTGAVPTELPASAPPEAPARKPALRPRNAATLIILDRTRRIPRILMGRRHPGLAFMPGKFVFPGGRIEPCDRHMTVAGALSARASDALAVRVPRGGNGLGRALALAAIRETYEETGLLLGTREYGPPETTPEGTWDAFRAAAVMPDLESLRFIARAVTPPGRARRFDTRFFAVDRTAVAHEVPGIVSAESELVELAWVTFVEARALDLPRITRVILNDLETQVRGGFAPYLPIPYYYERSGKPQRETL
ncbi:NUDIX domain-containing protein [Methylobacterium sp. Leaf117]|uniref:NUDIX hydrolase n=1 Tax=Methylobacterium sp. Leaf117 TaxID=1736260 RepID=UPI0006F846C3|nr:NUDIX domain-containing protein [Methylobacterium sp. Leaf117]KQP80866.1 NUDIX hydrolase [Methylobacterium sp. Leaf117]